VLPATLDNKDTINNNTKHKDMIRIDTIPFVLTEKEKISPTWKMKKKLATQDLQLAKTSLQRDLEQNIPVTFLDDIILTIAVNKKTMETEIDYSATKSKSAIRFVKLYQSGDMETFANEWLKFS
jgi:hypothetical protein